MLPPSVVSHSVDESAGKGMPTMRPASYLDRPQEDGVSPRLTFLGMARYDPGKIFTSVPQGIR
jgi:hypothetical protein